MAKKLYIDDDPQLEKKAQESINLVGRMLQKPHLVKARDDIGFSFLFEEPAHIGLLAYED